MKALFLIAVVLINGNADEQNEMVADLYDADPVLAADVLELADELLKADHNSLANIDLQAQIVGENGIVFSAADADKRGGVTSIVAVAIVHDDRTNERGADVTQDTYYSPKEPVKYHKGTRSVEGTDFP